jgi:hypothetical protein
MVGVEEADLLMDRPPGGWGDLVTKSWLSAELDRQDAVLDERFRSLDYRFDAIGERFVGQSWRFDAVDEKFAALEYKLMGAIHQGFRDQTWKLMTAMLGAMASLVAAMGVFVAIVRG